jgi:hypothetical protein
MSIDIFSVLGSPGGNSLIPQRDPGACTGSVFINNNINLMGAEREANILNEFLHGNIPDFLRNFTPVTVTNGNDSLTYLVMPDYLCIGSDDDYVRMPMNPHSAQTIADQYDCTLPTRKMVNDIWKVSVNKLIPQPWGPPYDADMQKTHRIGTHNNNINSQLRNTYKDAFALTSGHKKDVIIDKQLLINKHNVGIYGWINLNGSPIQDANCFAHDDYYADYSHGIRLISQDMIFNGNPIRFIDAIKHPVLSKAISDQGAYDASRIYK